MHVNEEKQIWDPPYQLCEDAADMVAKYVCFSLTDIQLYTSASKTQLSSNKLYVMFIFNVVDECFK